LVVVRAAPLLLAAACAASVAPAGDPELSPPLELGVASSLEKLRPGDRVPRATSIALAAARGECEAAQIAVRSARGLSALSAEAAPLSGAARLDVSLHRVAWLRLDRPSGPDGEAGEWPDPLVPVRDAWFDEPRRAFPTRVAPGRLAAVWVEICVPSDAPPGRYAGEVVLRNAGRRAAAVPIALEVWPFALPATSRFVAAFGLSTRLGTRALGVPDDREVARALAAAALRHRLTPHVLSADPPAGTCDAERCALDWRAYDAEMAPILDGALVRGVKGGFAEVRIPGKVWAGRDEDVAATLRAWRAHFEARGWADRLWLYTLDEPRPEQFGELKRRARLARAAKVPVFATIVETPELAEHVDAFVPNLTLAPRGRLRPRTGPDRFWYASCLSHGCGELPARGPRRAELLQAFARWPGYEIDRPGAAARAMGWLAWRRGLGGELYYDMLQTWTGDPWKDVRAFAGNGDGTLLYPGRPEHLGGRHPFPVESIRLKIIRDGLEDRELLALAEEAGLGALASKLAAGVARSERDWERRPGPWLEARRALGEALAARVRR
jgi:hypothetical protein